MSWQCPYRCKWRECIHVAAERVRLVCAEWEAAEVIISRARELVLASKLAEIRPPGVVSLVGALEVYDAAVVARGNAP